MVDNDNPKIFWSRDTDNAIQKFCETKDSKLYEASIHQPLSAMVSYLCTKKLFVRPNLRQDFQSELMARAYEELLKYRYQEKPSSYTYFHRFLIYYGIGLLKQATSAGIYNAVHPETAFSDLERPDWNIPVIETLKPPDTFNQSDQNDIDHIVHHCITALVRDSEERAKGAFMIREFNSAIIERLEHHPEDMGSPKDLTDYLKERFPTMKKQQVNYLLSRAKSIMKRELGDEPRSRQLARTKNIKYQIFGRLLVLFLVGYNIRGASVWWVMCTHCGSEFPVETAKLKAGARCPACQKKTSGRGIYQHKPHSSEVKLKMSLAHKGKKHRRGWHHSKESNLQRSMTVKKQKKLEKETIKKHV